MGLNPGGTRESPVLLAGACSGRRHFFPQNWGKNLIWKEIPNLGIVYSQCFYAENMAGKLKENYDAKFLEAIDFAFKKCQFNFVPKAEQVQAIHAVVTGNDVFVRVATGFGKSVCYVVVPYVCDYLRPESEVSSQSVLLMVSPLKALMEDQIDDIRKCGISCLKLHGELPSEQLHDVGAGKFQILICSPESLHEESVREQFLKLQKNIVCMAVDEAHCVLQW